jgi:hypothetical protein
MIASTSAVAPSGAVRFTGKLRRRRARVDAGAGVDKQADGGRAVLLSGPDERRLAVFVLVGVDVRAMRQQRPHRFRPARARRGHQDGLAALGKGGIRIRSRLEQDLDRLRVPVGRGQRQRLNPVAVGGLRVGAGAQQCADGHEIIGAHRPVERGRPVGFGRVHPLRVLQQREQGRPIAGFDRLDDQQSAVARRRRVQAHQRTAGYQPHATSRSNIHRRSPDRLMAAASPTVPPGRYCRRGR